MLWTIYVGVLIICVDRTKFDVTTRQTVKVHRDRRVFSSPFFLPLTFGEKLSLVCHIFLLLLFMLLVVHKVGVHASFRQFCCSLRDHSDRSLRYSPPFTQKAEGPFSNAQPRLPIRYPSYITNIIGYILISTYQFFTFTSSPSYTIHTYIHVSTISYQT